MKLYQDMHTTLFRSALYETLSAVIETEDLILVVDPCWLPDEVEEIRRCVDEKKDGRPLYLLFTHSDYDHIIAYRKFPDAQVIASRNFAEKTDAEREEILEMIRAFDDEYYIRRDYEIVYPEVDLVYGEDGDSLTVGDTRLVFYQAPGHNKDGLFTVVEPLGLLLAGDYFSEVEFPYIYVSSLQYEATIGKLDGILASHDIRLLVSGHGDPTDDRTAMRKRQSDSFAYIAAMREAVQTGDREAADRLIEGCEFPRNMRKFHHHNWLLFQKEHASAPHPPA